MMIEGFGSGSIPLTCGFGSGSWRPKNMWIRWIRIRNTAKNYGLHCSLVNITGIKQDIDSFPMKQVYSWNLETTKTRVSQKYGYGSGTPENVREA
jgi:hypothetical protein